MGGTMLPSKDEIESFLHYYGPQPESNYIFVFKKASPILKAVWYFTSSIIMFEGLFEKNALLIFSSEDIVIKKIAGFPVGLTRDSYDENITRILRRDIRDLSTMDYGANYYISFKDRKRQYEFYLPKYFADSERMRYSYENYEALERNHFCGLMTETDSGLPPENGKRIFRNLPRYASLYFILFTLFGYTVLRLSNPVFLLASFMAFGCMVLTFFISTDRWTRRNQRIQTLCLVLEAVSLFLYILSWRAGELDKIKKDTAKGVLIFILNVI